MDLQQKPLPSRFSPMKQRLCLLMFTAILGYAAPAAANAQSALATDVDRALKKAGDDLCKSLDVLKCKRKAVAKPKPRKPARKTAMPGKAKPPPSNILKPVAAKAIPIPRAKPAVPGSPSVTTAAITVPRPRQKPTVPGARAVQGHTQVTVTVPPTKPPVGPQAPPPSTGAENDCRASLRALGVSFTTPAARISAGRCSVAEPVHLTRWKAGGEDIEFPDGPILNCGFALKFGQWLKAEGAPIARRGARSALARLYTGPGYECRGRNGDGSGKVSEHGLGNAVDITFFTLQDGRTFHVRDALDPMSPAYQTLAGFRASGCKYFTTVLGPGANAAHAEHFHFDMGQHGKSAAYKICE